MTSFRRTKGSRKSHPITPRQGTIYGPPESEKLSEEVRQDTVEDTRESIRDLEEEFHSAKTHEHKERIFRATELEATRLKEDLNRDDLHRDTRARLEEEGRMYKRAADMMERELHGD